MKLGFDPMQLARPFGLAGAAILLWMMLFTTYSVISRQVFGVSVLGVVDIMELSLVGMIFIAMPGVFLRDGNITVDVIDSLLPTKAVFGLRLFSLTVTLAFLTLVLVRMIQPAISKFHDHEVTMTLEIPRYVHWMPILFGFAASVFAVILVIAGLFVHRGAARAMKKKNDQ